MILCDREIEAALRLGHIIIDPDPSPSHFSSTAIDLTLDSVLMRWREPAPSTTGLPTKYHVVRPHDSGFSVKGLTEDHRYAEKFSIPPEGFVLEPRSFILGFTEQQIYLPHKSRIAGRVEGKSSLARVGVGVHVTAPTIHAGFGLNEKNREKPGLPIQLEIFNLGGFGVTLDPRMRICQLILEEVREAPSKGYEGQFSSQAFFRAPKA